MENKNNISTSVIYEECGSFSKLVKVLQDVRTCPLKSKTNLTIVTIANEKKYS